MYILPAYALVDPNSSFDAFKWLQFKYTQLGTSENKEYQAQPELNFDGLIITGGNQ